MKTFVKMLFVVSVVVFSINHAHAASTLVTWLNTPETVLLDRNGNLLSAGTVAAADGAVLQLGYYSLGTQSSPFTGDWNPMTGPGSGSDFYSSIGDKIQPAGRFNISTFFVPGDPSPLSQIPLVIRFYDSTSLATSTYFNAVSNTSGLWNWKLISESNPSLSISLADSGIVWLDGAGSVSRTTIPIPEPATVTLLLLASWVGIVRRTRF